MTSSGYVKRGVGLNLRLDTIDEVIFENPKVDFFEIIVDNWFSLGPHHKKLERIRRDYEISFHCVGMNLGGVDDLNISYLEKVRDLASKYNPFQISDHLCFQKHNAHSFHDLLPFPFNEEGLSNTVERIKRVQHFLDRSILVENLSYYIEFNESNISEIDFTNRVLEKADCHMLLDINNLWVNYRNLNLSVEDYLEKLDWSRVREVHVAGAELFGTTYVDTHGSPVNSEVLKLTNKYKDKLVNLPVIYEQDNNIKDLRNLLLQVDRVRNSLGGSL